MYCSLFESKKKEILCLRDDIAEEKDQLMNELIEYCKKYDVDHPDPLQKSRMYVKIVQLSDEIKKLDYAETLLTQIVDDELSCNLDHETLIKYIKHGVFEY